MNRYYSVFRKLIILPEWLINDCVALHCTPLIGDEDIQTMFGNFTTFIISAVCVQLIGFQFFGLRIVNSTRNFSLQTHIRSLPTHTHTIELMIAIKWTYEMTKWIFHNKFAFAKLLHTGNTPNAEKINFRWGQVSDTLQLINFQCTYDSLEEFLNMLLLTNWQWCQWVWCKSECMISNEYECPTIDEISRAEEIIFLETKIPCFSMWKCERPKTYHSLSEM